MKQINTNSDFNVRKNKSVSRRYIGVVFNENDLNRIANIMFNEASKYNEKLNIEIYSSMRRESFFTSDPNVFFSNEIPNEISKVSISFRDSESSITCEVEMGRTIWNGDGIDVSISGNDFIVVSGIFTELDKEIKLRYATWRWLFTRKGKFVLFSLNLILAVSIYSLFDFILKLLTINQILLKTDFTYIAIASIGWGTIGVMLGLGYGIFEDYLKSLFPALQFSGRFISQSSKNKKMLLWIISFILIPIFINLISSKLVSLL